MTTKKKDRNMSSASVVEPNQKVIPLEKVRWKLARLWLLMGGFFVVLLIAQSLMGKYHDKVQNVWSWALPSIMPTFSLMMTVLGANAFQSKEEEPSLQIRQPFYRVVFWLSLIYLTILIGTVLVEPFTPYESVELLNLSNFWLAPLQAFVASAIAILFFARQAK